MKFYFYVSIVLLGCFEVFPQVPTNGLIAHYPFDGNASDVSGNNHDGIINGPVSTTDRFGNNNAFYFDGIDDYLTLPNEVIKSTYDEISIFFWIYMDDVGSGNNYIFSARKNGSDDIRLILDHRFKAALDDATQPIPETNGGDHNFNNFEWHHLGITFNSSGMRLYSGGVQVALDTDPFTFFDPLTTVIGKRSIYTPYFFHGALDEFRIYDRALTVIEIGELFNEGSAPEAPIIDTPSNITTSTFTANWSTVANATYLLDVSTDASFTTFVINDQPVTTTNYNVTGLSAGTIYYYRVQSTNGNGTSAESTSEQATTLVNSDWIYNPGTIHTDDVTALGVGGIPPQGYQLSVDGKAIAEEITVELSGLWPDYVFSKGYDLKSPEELAQFIKEHGHLPDVPTEKEVSSEGISLGKMNAILLKKIEELTLLLIRQNKRIKTLEEQSTGKNADQGSHPSTH